MQTENTYVETDLGNIALNPRGEYLDEASYEYLDIVSYKGGSYMCLAELTKTVSGIAPVQSKNTEHWQMLTLPGGLTSDYITMHDDVVNKAKQVETSRAAAELSQQEVEAAQADVSQMRQDTQEAAEEAASSRDSAAGYAQSAEASRTAAKESEDNINAQVVGFDAHVAEKTSAAEISITEARRAAVSAVSTKQDNATQAVTDEGNKQIKNVEDAGTEQVGKAKSAGASAVSAADAAGVSAVNAVKTQQTASIKAVADEGTQQVTAVNTAGSTQASIIETKGADQVKAIQEAGENALQNISDGVDKGLSEEGKAADAKATGEAISNLTEDIDEISEVDETDNEYNPFSDECIDESYLQTFDIIEDTRLKISNKIHVKKGDIVRFIKNSFTNKNAGAIYNTNGLPQVSIYSNGYTEETWNDYVICASVSPIDGYYLVNMEKRGDATVNMIFVNKSFPADGKFVPYHRERLIRKSCIEKYIEPFELTANVLNGNYEEVYSNIPLSFNKVDGYYNKNGKFFANEGYEEAVVEVKKGEKYYLTSYNYFQIARAFFRDSSGTFVGSVYTANNNKLEENTEVAIPENAVTMHLQRLTNKRVELLGKTGYELIARVNEVSPLYGKKLVTAGDSYTHASFSGNYAEYDGKNYGYYVAKRHGMTFINSGMSGSIMALDKDYVANPTSVPITSRNPFSYQRYLDVPEDTDYLTIWFGINDNAHTNLGTIDDATNETFYGAWNKVLRYYLTNRPFMKVGLIVTVGASERYRQAIRDVAKKWGYPYLDWVNDDSIPAFFDRTGMSDEARTLRRQAYGYNNFSAHPNPQFHEYASTIYEKFLLSL